MRAMVAPRFGAPEVFEERDVEMPQPGPGEILVRVVASDTNPKDAKFRAAGGSRGLEALVILGADVSGVVEEVGPGVTDLTPPSFRLTASSPPSRARPAHGYATPTTTPSS